MQTLFAATSLVDILGMGISLWLALYLLARGYPSRVTIRAVIVLLALSIFFLSASINLYLQISGSTAIRAIMLTAALAVWCDLTPNVVSPNTQNKKNWIAAAIYGFAAITVILLFGTRNAFVQEQTNLLYVGRMSLGYQYTVYAVYLWCVGFSILYSISLGRKSRMEQVNIYFVAASLLTVGEIVYGSFSLALTNPSPRIVQDAMIVGAVIFLGISIARHQTLVERRTALYEMPIHALVTFGFALLYAFIAWEWSHSMTALILTIDLAVFTHSLYGLVSEILEALAARRASKYRQQLRHLEKDQPSEIPLETRLENGLKLLCEILEAEGGLIATRHADGFVVAASFQSLAVKTSLSQIETTTDEDVYPPPENFAEAIAWLAPACKDDELLALVGIGHPLSKHHYSADDLDLLAEAATRVASMLALAEIPRPESDPRVSLESESAQLISTLETNPDPKFLKLVEDGLRNLSDIITLGQSPLADELKIAGKTHIDRGKILRQELVDAIEALRPEGARPKEPTPREWENYVILHDAYIEGVQNREVMMRLYISEGTFNRSRRKALRGVARYLLEKPRL
jgi:hypothetical protein